MLSSHTAHQTIESNLFGFLGHVSNIFRLMTTLSIFFLILLE
jgi:hypothetical protein